MVDTVAAASDERGIMVMLRRSFDEESTEWKIVASFFCGVPCEELSPRWRDGADDACSFSPVLHVHTESPNNGVAGKPLGLGLRWFLGFESAHLFDVSVVSIRAARTGSFGSVFESRDHHLDEFDQVF